jgi:hypothetical protein
MDFIGITHGVIRLGAAILTDTYRDFPGPCRENIIIRFIIQMEVLLHGPSVP